MGQKRTTSPRPPLVAAVFGPESFLVRQAIADLIADVLGESPAPMAVSDIDGDSAELADVLDELRTLPFFGDHRVVLVRNADAFVSAHRAVLEDYVQQPCPTGTLVLACKSLPANTRLYKLISKSGRVANCRSPRGMEINRWITSRCRNAYGASIDAQAVSRLRELAGDSLASLDNELAKLSLYAGPGARITREQVNELVGVQREETVFGIIEAMLTGDATAAITLWAQVWATDRAAPARAIGGLAWALRRVINAKTELAAGAPIGQVAARMWTDPDRLRAQVDGYALGELEWMLAELRDADLAAKTGRASVREAVERLIIHTACGQVAGRQTTCA